MANAVLKRTLQGLRKDVEQLEESRARIDKELFHPRTGLLYLDERLKTSIEETNQAIRQIDAFLGGPIG